MSMVFVSLSRFALCLSGLAMLTTACGHTVTSASPVGRSSGRPDSATPSISRQEGALPISEPAAACARYLPRYVARADLAFDGTVTAIGDEHADPRNAVMRLVPTTFEVHHWFKGGPGATITIDIPVGFSEDPQRPPFQVDTRLLVSGNRPTDTESQQPAVAVASGCGYTRYYDPATAATWLAAVR